MKSTLWLFMPIVAHAVTLPLARRQMLPATLEAKPAFKVEEIEPTIAKPGVKAVRLWYGPYKIQAANGTDYLGNMPSFDPSGTAYAHTVESDFPKDMTVLTTESQVVYTSDPSQKADISNGIYNHHLYVADRNKSQRMMVKCPDGHMPPTIGLSMFMGTGEDKGPFLFAGEGGKQDAGYYVGQEDDIIMAVDLVNYMDEVKEVYIIYDMQYIPGRAADTLETSYQLLGLNMCDESTVEVHPEPGKQSAFESKDMTITEDGTFLAFKGHLHDGGVSIIAEVNGKEVCDSKAIYGGEGAEYADWSTISEMVYCTEPVPVSKGDILKLTAKYDLAAHPARAQAHGGMAENMAIMTVWFAQKPE